MDAPNATATKRRPSNVLTIGQRLERLTIPEPNSGCWLWLGSHWKGYGRMRTKSQSSAKAHRVSYEHHVGPIPDGLVLDHLCRNTFCVNPDHLEPVTNDENLKRSPLYYGYQDRCKNGHEYTAETVTIRHKKPGHTERICILCARDRAKAQRERANGLPNGDPRHGTANGYRNHGCRCADCTAAHAIYDRAKRKRRAERDASKAGKYRAQKAEASS
jgi:hypothetical protein